MATKITEKDEHIHIWKQYNLSEERCTSLFGNFPCTRIRISSEEYNRRIKEWNEYYKMIENTPAKRSYDQMKIAFKSNDLEDIKEIKGRIEQKGHWGENTYGDKVWVVDKTDLETPDFPDPLIVPFRYILTT